MSLAYASLEPRIFPKAAELTATFSGKDLNRVRPIPARAALPRIAKQVVSHWGHKEFERFASDLIIDNRGDRRGLPKEVLSDILFLYALHLDMVGYNPQDSFVPSTTGPTR